VGPGRQAPRGKKKSDTKPFDTAPQGKRNVSGKRVPKQSEKELPGVKAGEINTKGHYASTSEKKPRQNKRPKKILKEENALGKHTASTEKDDSPFTLEALNHKKATRIG